MHDKYRSPGEKYRNRLKGNISTYDGILAELTNEPLEKYDASHGNDRRYIYIYKTLLIIAICWLIQTSVVYDGR